MSIDKSCELCGTNNEYCPECGTCHKCLREVNLSLQQLAAEAAKLGHVVVPVRPSGNIIGAMKMSTSVTVGPQTYHVDMYPAYHAMIEAGAVKVEE